MEEIRTTFKVRDYEWSLETIKSELSEFPKKDVTLIKADLSFAEMNGFLQFVLSVTEFVKKRLHEGAGQWLEFQAKWLLAGADVAGARETLNALAVEFEKKGECLGEYAQAARLFNAVHPNRKANHIQWSTKEIMERSNNDQLAAERLKCQLSAFNEQFEVPVDYTENVGFLEKVLYRGNPDVIVVGEVFGEVERLKKMLELLKKLTKLDENYRCKGDFRLIFLGNYSDKNMETKGLEAIELLAALKMANPNNIFLLRGEREMLEDSGYEDFGVWEDFSKENSELAQGFGKRLPLSLFLAGNTTKKVYVEFAPKGYLGDINNFLNKSEMRMGVPKDEKIEGFFSGTDRFLYFPLVIDSNNEKAVHPLNSTSGNVSQAMIVLFNQDGTLWGHQGIHYDSGSGYERDSSTTKYN